MNSLTSITGVLSPISDSVKSAFIRTASGRKLLDPSPSASSSSSSPAFTFSFSQSLPVLSSLSSSPRKKHCAGTVSATQSNIANSIRSQHHNSVKSDIARKVKRHGEWLSPSLTTNPAEQDGPTPLGMVIAYKRVKVGSPTSVRHPITGLSSRMTSFSPSHSDSQSQGGHVTAATVPTIANAGASVSKVDVRSRSPSISSSPHTSLSSPVRIVSPSHSRGPSTSIPLSLHVSNFNITHAHASPHPPVVASIIPQHFPPTSSSSSSPSPSLSTSSPSASAPLLRRSMDPSKAGVIVSTGAPQVATAYVPSKHTISSASSTTSSSTTTKVKADRRQRRSPEELSDRERWYCPFNCGKFYGKHSTQSIRSHVLQCTKASESRRKAYLLRRKKKRDAIMAAAATRASKPKRFPQRKILRRRTPSELRECEKWYCPHASSGCTKFYRKSSTKSIRHHTSSCPFIGSSES